MNFYAISALVNFITSLILGTIVIYKGRNSKNVSFFIFCFFVAFWSLSYFIWQISKTPTEALFWCRTLMAWAIFIPVAYLHFVYALVEKLDKRRKFLIFSYSLFFLFLISDLTPYFVNRIELVSGFGPWPMAGPFYSLFLIVWFFYVVYSTYLLYEKYKISSGIVRLQIKYVIIGMVIGFAGGSTNYFLWYKIPVPPMANILVSVYVGAIGYAIIRYRLMDIRIIARKIFIYFGVAVFTYGAFYLVIWSYEKFFGGAYTKGAFLAGIVVAPVFVFLFYTMDRGFKIIANKYFFASLYNYHETINKLITELNHYIDLRKIIDTIVDTIKRTMQLDRAGVLLVDPESQPIRYQISKVVGFNIHNGISLVQDNFLTRYLQKTQRPLVREELIYLAENSVNQKDKQAFQKLHDDMKHIEASLCLPLMSSKKLIGIIVLGSKISKDAYTKEDLDLLDTLSKQAGIAVENAQLYQKIRDFSKTLEQKVNEQTKDLRDKADHLQRLLTMRSQFLDIASHQLKTPVSVILGTASMFKEGAMDQLPKEKQLHFIDNIFVKAKKLNNIISDILKASEMDSEDFTLKTENIKKTQVMNVINEVADELKPMAEERQLMFEVVKPKVKLPEIMADAIFLKHAIYNLADNAIKYTKEGFVKIEAVSDKENIHLKISDSGIGIPGKDQKKMFDKFARASNAVNMYTDGSGLGIFIVKKVVDAQEGRVWFESEENKGTTFYIDLPLKNKYG